MSNIKHDLDHEVYLDPKDGKEHINHGKMEYTKEDLESAHAYYDEYHKDDEPETGINDWHLRHQDKHLEVYCDNHPDAEECSCLLYTSPSPRDVEESRMPSSA